MTKDEQTAEGQQQEQTEEEVTEEELDLDNTPDEDEEGNERNWKHEALKERAIRQRREKKLQEAQQQPQQPEQKQEKKQEKKEDKNEDDDFEEIVQITNSVKDLTNDELQELKSLSEELGVPQKKLITSKAWNSRLNEIRNEQKEENQVPASSQRSARKPSKSWGEMSKKERQTYFNQQVENTRKSKNLE